VVHKVPTLRGGGAEHGQRRGVRHVQGGGGAAHENPGVRVAGAYNRPLYVSHSAVLPQSL
jgi:hypothetical protein